MRKIGNGIDFADSNFKSCEISGDENVDTVIVYINSWDAKIIKLVFSNVVHFSFKWGSFIEGLYQMEEDEFFKKTMIKYDIANPSQFKKYSIIDIEDNEFIEVVAEDVTVSKELRSLESDKAQ